MEVISIVNQRDYYYVFGLDLYSFFTNKDHEKENIVLIAATYKFLFLSFPLLHNPFIPSLYIYWMYT
jgi:hypothetical protein